LAIFVERYSRLPRKAKFPREIKFVKFVSSGPVGANEEMDFETVHNIDEWGAETVSVNRQ
jgi:hypothetical protein